MVKEINFTSETFVSSFDFTLGFLKSRVLKVGLVFVRGHNTEVVLKFTKLIILFFKFVTAVSKLLVLSGYLLMICFKVSIATF